MYKDSEQTILMDNYKTRKQGRPRLTREKKYINKTTQNIPSLMSGTYRFTYKYTECTCWTDNELETT